MKKLMVATLCVLSVGIASAEVYGGASSNNNVWTVPSDSFPFPPADKAGLKLPNSTGGKSAAIGLENGPISYINKVAPGTYGAGYLTPKIVSPIANLLPSIIGNTPIAQVWKHQANQATVYSIRQIIKPPFFATQIPDFGGLTIGAVHGSPVYFGEWSPKGANYAAQSSTDLNMGSNQRSVWYVGENPTKSMPYLVNARYAVTGIYKHVPMKDDFFHGTLIANYGGGRNSLDGSMTRYNNTIYFNGTRIASNGTFANNQKGIEGRFYGSNAQALAGIYKKNEPGASIAFGGKRQ